MFNLKYNRDVVLSTMILEKICVIIHDGCLIIIETPFSKEKNPSKLFSRFNIVSSVKSEKPEDAHDDGFHQE